MQDDLYCSFSVPHDLPPPYWWTLVFEGLQQCNIHFQKTPGWKSQGTYFSMTKHMDEFEGDFRQLWDAINDADDVQHVYCWSWSQEFCLVASVKPEVEQQRTEIALSVTEGWLEEVGTLQPQVAEQFIAACLAVYRLCCPSSSFFLRWFDQLRDTPLLYVDEQATRMHPSLLTLWDHTFHWKELTLSGIPCLLLDPFPLYIRAKGWASLFQKSERRSGKVV